jgi:hypothetical protein
MKAGIAYARAIELRKTNRYRLSASVRFGWASHDGLPQYGEGSTRDINISGVYVLSDALPPLGSLIQLDILLPNLKGTAPGMRLYGEGRVFRCEPRGAKDTGATENGFAASVQFYPAPSELKLSRFESSGYIFRCAGSPSKEEVVSFFGHSIFVDCGPCINFLPLNRKSPGKVRIRSWD